MENHRKKCYEERVVKARLAAKGFQEKIKDNLSTDHRHVQKKNLRITLALAATNFWTVKLLDIKSAYLQGKEIERLVYVKRPVEVTRDQLWRLKKAIYGLNDAARVWNLKVKEELGKMGVMKSKYDKAIFHWKKDAVLLAMWMTSVEQHCSWAMLSSHLKQKFKVSAEGADRFTYIGLQIDQNAKYITISQKQDNDIYAITIPDDVAMTDPLDKIQQLDLKSLTGK